jgi:hypothetical protein
MKIGENFTWILLLLKLHVAAFCTSRTYAGTAFEHQKPKVINWMKMNKKLMKIDENRWKWMKNEYNKRKWMKE